MAERLSRYDAWMASKQKKGDKMEVRPPLQPKRENLYSSRWQITQEPTPTYRSAKAYLITSPPMSTTTPATAAKPMGSPRGITLPWTKSKVNKDKENAPPTPTQVKKAEKEDKDRKDKKEKKMEKVKDKKEKREKKDKPSSSKSNSPQTAETSMTQMPPEGGASNTTPFPIVKYPFMCTNCGDQFKSEEGYITHFGNQNLACVYKDNEPVTDLDKFTIQNMMKSMMERRGQVSDEEDIIGHEMYHTAAMGRTSRRWIE